MSDDEEVVIKGSELHTYMEMNDIASLHTDIVDKQLSSSKDNVDQENKVTVPCLFGKFEFSENAGNIIYSIIQTGLLFPDHVVDLENHIKVKNVKEEKLSKTRVTLHCSCFVASSSAFMILNKKLNVLSCICLAAATSYFGYRIYKIINNCHNLHRIKSFTNTIELLYSATKKSLSFIVESEFILRGRITKGQEFYVPNSGWVIPNSNEGLKYSGLIVPELRKFLLSAYLNVIIIFRNFHMFIKKVLPFISDFCNDISTIEPLDEYYDLIKQSSLIPNSEDLRKINNVYLVTQSECLKHLIFCFVEGLWLNKSSWKSLNLIIQETTEYVDTFKSYARKLESLYQKCFNELKNNNRPIRGGTLKVNNANDRIYTFTSNFLSKADAHMLSMLLDLRMINDWINEFEVNNENNENYSNQFVLTLYDRLHLMKSNIQCFTNLYNDNCNILKSMIHLTSENVSVNNMDSQHEPLDRGVQPTGIEVGKSNFDVTGEDEVLISLSNTEVINELNDMTDVDYEDQVFQKCLPRTVLDELKFALKGKKEEWIEREKKATLNSNLTIDNLELDNLLNSNDSEYKKSDSSKVLNKHNYTSEFSDCDLSKNESEYLSAEEGERSLSSFERTINTSSEEDVNKSLETNISNLKQGDGFKVNKCTLLDEDRSDDEKHNSVSGKQFSSMNSFADQIKFAQKSFNLIMTEEEYLEGSSEDEIND